MNSWECRAGTGLLSMMAARAMSSSNETTCSTTKVMVTACESYLPMVKLMRKVLRANGMERKVRIINKRSDEVVVGVDIASRADVLVSFLTLYDNNLRMHIGENQNCRLFILDFFDRGKLDDFEEE